MDRDFIINQLFRHYLKNLVPAGAIFAGWAIYKNMAGIPEPIAPEIMGPAVFVAALVAALALPILARTRFVKAVADRKHVAPEPFLAFQKALLTMCLASAYIAAVGYVCTIGLFHFGGAFLAALYAAYYYFPSEERVAHEMRLFRVRDEATGDVSGTDGESVEQPADEG